ncbi:MAG: YqjF family protein [Flavisolibacter sp.]
MSQVFLRAKWLNLIMVNYEVDPALLKAHLPRHTELDFYNGTCFVSLVGFLFKDTKLKGIPIPLHRTFEEVNLRFYVRQKENNKWKRGVVFLREIVPLPAITTVANLVYKENYRTHSTKHIWNLAKEEWQVEYQWKLKKDWNHLKVFAESSSHPIEQGSEEEFIAIQNWGYTRVNEHKTSIYQVHHPNWLIHPVRRYHVKCNIENMYGVEFVETLSQAPRSVFLAEGSDVSVMHKTTLNP